MINQEDAALGTTVFLRPTTKLAIRECYQRLAAVLVSYERWPMVLVRVFDEPDNPYGREITVHRDNIGLRRKTKQREQGDGANQPESRSGMVGRPFAKPHPPVSGYDEPVLF